MASQLGIARDNREDLTSLIGEGLSYDVLILSGGVSAGVLDLVPRVLAEAGVEQVFHKVNLKPGKPLWFGAKENAEFGMRNAESQERDRDLCQPGETPHSEFRIPHSATLVFGLPGNPVSTLVCFKLFVRPALLKMTGCDRLQRPRIKVRALAAGRGISLPSLSAC